MLGPTHESIVMSTKEAQKLEADTFSEGDCEQPIPPPDIVAYNELRSCVDLVRMHGSGKLELQPDFQRDVVSKAGDQSRFIDSLVKQVPIPSMCFSLDYKTQHWKVIDGLQRMSSIVKFLSAAGTSEKVIKVSHRSTLPCFSKLPRASHDAI